VEFGLYRNGVTNQAAYTYPRTTVGNTRHRLPPNIRWRTGTGSSTNLASFSENNVIPNLKSGSISRQQHSPIVRQWTTCSIPLKSTWRLNRKYLAFAIITVFTDVVPKQKRGYQAITVRIHDVDRQRATPLSNDYQRWQAITRSGEELNAEERIT